MDWTLTYDADAGLWFAIRTEAPKFCLASETAEGANQQARRAVAFWMSK